VGKKRERKKSFPDDEISVERKERKN